MQKDHIPDPGPSVLYLNQPGNQEPREDVLTALQHTLKEAQPSPDKSPLSASNDPSAAAHHPPLPHTTVQLSISGDAGVQVTLNVNVKR